MGPEFDISMKIFCTLRPATKPTPLNLHSSTLEPTSTVTHWLCKETGAQLEEN